MGNYTNSPRSNTYWCPLGQPVCTHCQYRPVYPGQDTDYCYHPDVSGYTIDQIISIKKTEKYGDTPQEDSAVVANIQRIQNAVLLDTYYQWVTEHSNPQVRCVPINQISLNLLQKVIGKGILYEMIKYKLIANSSTVVARIVTLDNWVTFNVNNNMTHQKLGLHKIAELNLAALLLFNQTSSERAHAKA